jgi:hypothetical protein
MIMRLGRNPFMQRLWLLLGLILAFALTGCGSSGIKYNEFIPKRIIVIGDEITYVGCTTPVGQTTCSGIDKFDRFSINSSSAAGSTPLVNNWVMQVALNYGLSFDKIVEPSVAGDAVRDAKLGARAIPPASGSTSWVSVRDQAGLIPAYSQGDMVVVAGGANDILAVLRDSSITSTSGISFKRGLTSTLANKIIADLGVTLSTAKAYAIMAAAQNYQDIALDLIRNRGQRYVFMAPVYDFSNSPDLDQFCQGCTADQVKQGVSLFNYVLRLLTDDNFDPLVFSSGQPRILLTSGTTSYDLFYVNITNFSTVLGSAVYNYDIAHSVCGASSTLSSKPADLRGCTWNGLYGSSGGVDPAFNGSSYNAAPYPDFIANQGKYVYAQNLYLTPNLHGIIGNTFVAFMRGYNGW